MAQRRLDSALQIPKFRPHVVTAFRLERACGRPDEASIDVLMEDQLDPDDFVGQSAVLHYGYEGEDEQLFPGVIESVSAYGAPDSLGRHLYNYRFNVVHPLALLAWDEGTEWFQDQDVKDVVTKVLKRSGLEGDAVDFRLTATYPKRDFCVRYNESGLAFISRLCEQEGIFYFTEIAEDGKVKLVFADDSTAASPIAGDHEIKFNVMQEKGDSILSITDRRRVVSGKFVLRDFNFTTPKVDLTATATADVDTDLEIYDYPGLYEKKPDGDRLAKVRLEAEQATRHTVDIVADSARLAPGKKLKISEAHHEDANGEFVVLSVSYEMRRHVDTAEDGQSDDAWNVLATLLPADKKYRLPQVTPTPIIEGPQTARVVAPTGSKPEEIHTEEHGRAKVKFHWDLGPDEDDKASAWFRVGQMQTSGSVLLPRVGWEVIVEFLEGNPDRPVVTGKLYNGTYMPPYALPEGKTRTAIRSSSTPGGGGTNEIRTEDKAGGEEIMIHATHNKTVKAANNKKKNVGNNETRTVKANRTMKVGVTQDVKISKSSQHTITGDQKISVGGLRKVEVNAVTGLTVKGDATTTVGGVHFEMDGNPLEALIALATAKAAEMAAEKAKQVAGQVVGAVQGKVNQVMGPVNSLVGKAQAIGAGMKAVSNGNLGAAAGVLAGAAGLPSAGGFAKAAGGGGGGEGGGGGDHAASPGGGGDGSEAGRMNGGPAATSKAGPGGSGESAGGISAGNILGAAMNNAIQKGIRKGAKALKGGGGGDAKGGGAKSDANKKGAKGDANAVDGGDNDKGPGHSLNKVDGSITETIGPLRLLATASGINENASGSLTQTIGAVRVELVWGNRAEAVEGMKTENSIGYIVVSKSHETEAVGGAKMGLIGGAIVEKVTGGHTVSAKGPATFIGAMHKVEAKTKITWKCGASEVVLDGGGLAIKSPLVMILCGKIEMPKAAAEV